jgi:FkbM family methyltransferase
MRIERRIMISLGRTVLQSTKSIVSPSRGNLVGLELTERGEQLNALCPDDEVFTLCRELVLDRIYERGGFAFSSNLRTVVDAGAHAGIFSLMASRWADRVVSIEASQINFDLLKLNIDRNHIANIDARHRALWSKSGQFLDLDASAESGCGRVNSQFRSITRGNTVESISLDDLIEEIGPIDLLKIDIEGAEYETFRACSKLSCISSIVGEMHILEAGDTERLQTLVAHLEDAGFHVVLVDESELYSRDSLDRLMGNSTSLKGNRLTKALAAAYYLAPISKPIRRKGATYQLPLLVAQQTA